MAPAGGRHRLSLACEGEILVADQLGISGWAMVPGHSRVPLMVEACVAREVRATAICNRRLLGRAPEVIRCGFHIPWTMLAPLPEGTAVEIRFAATGQALAGGPAVRPSSDPVPGSILRALAGGSEAAEAAFESDEAELESYGQWLKARASDPAYDPAAGRTFAAEALQDAPSLAVCVLADNAGEAELAATLLSLSRQIHDGFSVKLV
jgi:hypothetical protein